MRLLLHQHSFMRAQAVYLRHRRLPCETEGDDKPGVHVGTCTLPKNQARMRSSSEGGDGVAMGAGSADAVATVDAALGSGS